MTIGLHWRVARQREHPWVHLDEANSPRFGGPGILELLPACHHEANLLRSMLELRVQGRRHDGRITVRIRWCLANQW